MPDAETELVPLKELSRKQRRVLGTLLEKAFTTPDQYPLTLKSCTTGCNQKNNRDPVSNYDEDIVARTLDELREIGFVAVLHTEGGRTERYRHYMRHRTTLNEPQLAILTELMLRGKQQLGELRTRASRMVAIETLEQLRAELTQLQQLGLVRSNGSLDRRGAEVDHNLYPAGENREEFAPLADEPVVSSSAADRESTAPRAPAMASASPRTSEDVSRLLAEIERLSREQSSLKDELADVKSQLSSLADRFDDLRRQLGG